MVLMKFKGRLLELDSVKFTQSDSQEGLITLEYTQKNEGMLQLVAPFKNAEACNLMQQAFNGTITSLVQYVKLDLDTIFEVLTKYVTHEGQTNVPQNLRLQLTDTLKLSAQGDEDEARGIIVYSKEQSGNTRLDVLDGPLHMEYNLKRTQVGAELQFSLANRYGLLGREIPRVDIIFKSDTPENKVDEITETISESIATCMKNYQVSGYIDLNTVINSAFITVSKSHIEGYEVMTHKE